MGAFCAREDPAEEYRPREPARVALTLRAGHATVPAQQKLRLDCLASLRVQDQAEQCGGVPVDLVCVLDCSESMTGAKIRLLKQTLGWLLTELR